jgi:hypothetical protein
MIELTEQQQHSRFVTAWKHFAGYIESLPQPKRDAFIDSLAEGALVS